MFKTTLSMAFAAVALSAIAQSTTTTTTTTTQTTPVNRHWISTYNVSSVDIPSTSMYDMRRAIDRQLWSCNAADAITIDGFLDRLPSDQELVMLRAMFTNFKQASIVRDEVAMSQFGTPETYAWLGYPALTWTSTPGQNSWSSITMTDTTTGVTTTTTTTTMATDYTTAIAITDDSSRPMRMVMSHRGHRDINYEDAVDILGSGLDDHEKGILYGIFQPTHLEFVGGYTNEDVLDACIRFINDNAMLVDHLDRYTWYNHHSGSVEEDRD